MPFAGAETSLGKFALFVTEQAHGKRPFEYTYRYQLWRTNGTATSTHRIFPPHGGYFRWSPTSVIAAGQRAFIVSANQLMSTDGTTAGTRTLAGFAGIRWAFPAVHNGSLYLAATRYGRSGLWKTDGTAKGTLLIKGGLTSTRGGTSITALAANGNRVFFVSRHSPTSPSDLWMTAGSVGSTHLVRQFPAKAVTPSSLTSAGPRVFFTASDGVHGNELWSSNGNPEGTAMVRDIRSGPQGSSITSLTSDGNQVYFQADNVTRGEQLWKSDGTRERTVMVRNIAPGAKRGILSDLTPFGGVMYFSAAQPIGATQLWSTDGTYAGTNPVKSNTSGGPYSDPYFLTVAGDHLFFTATDLRYGNELWGVN